MSYYAYDADGYLGDVASSKGWEDALRVLLRNTGAPLRMFAERGYTQDPQELARALDELAARGYAYSPDQPRVPAGDEHGGEFAPDVSSLPKEWQEAPIAFHGSDVKFDQFDPAQMGKRTDPGFFGAGAYLVDDKENAARWGEHVIRGVVLLKNPLKVSGMSDFIAKAGQRPLTEKPGTPEHKAAYAKEMNRVTTSLIASGHDGVVYTRADGKTQYVAFFPDKQVKIFSLEERFDASSVSFTFTHLAELARTADGVLIISDGVVEDPDARGYEQEQSDFSNRIVWREGELVVLPGAARRYDEEEEGEWRTINGRRVLIRDGETPAQAITRYKMEQARELEGSAGGAESSRVLAETFRYPPPEITEVVRRDIQNYVTSSGGLNGMLRSGLVDAEPFASLRAVVTKMDTLFETSTPTAIPMMVSRVIPMHVAQKLGLTDGAVVRDLSYVSTSLSKAVVDKFMPGQASMIFDIKVPAGSRVLSIPSTGVRNQFTMREAEVLLPRGSSFRISSIKGNVVSAELLPAGQMAEFEFNPDQARDDHGRWSGDGSASNLRKIRELLQKVTADPRVIAAELENEVRGDARNDPGVRRPDGSYTSAGWAENQQIAQSFLKPDAQAKPGEAPRAILLIGKPGAGKSTLLAKIPGLPPAVLVNPDEIMGKIPGHRNTLGTAYHERASDIAQQNLLPAAVAGRYNMVLDQSGKNPQKMESLAKSLTALGYKITIIQAEATDLTAAERVYSRFTKGGRYMPVELAATDYKCCIGESYNKIKTAYADEWRHYDTNTREARLVDSGTRSSGKRALGQWDGGHVGEAGGGSFEDDQGVLAEGGSAVLFGSGRTVERDGQVDLIFDPSQPRDSHGRWGDGNGGASAGLKKYLEMVSKLQEGNATARGWKYGGEEEFVLKNGKAFKTPVDLPKGIRSDKLGLCYMNAYRLADSHPELTYVEGYATVHGVPIGHAWTVDKQGNVVDSTFFGKGKSPTKGVAYFGVPLSTAFVRQTIMARGKYGVIHNREQNFPLLQHGLPAEAKAFSAADSKNAPLYVHRPVVNADDIIAWAKEQGFTTTLPASDMHVTICYSKAPVDWQAAGWPRPDELRFAFDPSQPRDGQGQWTDGGGDSSIIEGAAAIAAMNPKKRDDTEIGDFPGGSAAYNLYEARTLLPKPSDKLKKVGDNTFSLGRDYDYIANVDGHHYGVSKYEDPDEPDDDSKFVFAYQRLDRATRTSSMRETTTSDVKDLFEEIRALEWVNAGKMKQHSFNPDQPRDAHGQWMDGIETYDDAFARMDSNRKQMAVLRSERRTIEPDTRVISELDRAAIIDNKIDKLYEQQIKLAELLSSGKLRTNTLEESGRKVTALGDDGDAIVLQFAALALQDRWQEFRDVGASWDYESYHPHVTITYDKPEGLDLADVVPYAGPIRLGPEVFEDIEEGWHEGIEEHDQDNEGHEGRWITMNGRHVFLREGETPKQALERFEGSTSTKGLSNSEIIKRAEMEILGFDLIQSKYWGEERRSKEYKEKIKVVIPLVRSHGFMRAAEILKTVGRYTASQYAQLNNALRAGKELRPAALIDDFIKASPKVQKDILFRGVSKELFGKLKVGDTITDLAFVSTTSDRKVAEHFSKRRGKGGVLEIAGVRGVAAAIPASDESEFLLPRQSKFRVVSNKDGVARLKLLPAGKKNYEIDNNIVFVNLEEDDQVHTHAQLTPQEEAYYAQVKKNLDDIEATSQDDLRKVFALQRDKIVAKVKGDGAAAVEKSLKELPHRRQLQTAMQEMLQRAFDLGGKDARVEVQQGVKEHAQGDEVWRTVLGRRVLISGGVKGLDSDWEEKLGNFSNKNEKALQGLSQEVMKDFGIDPEKNVPFGLCAVTCTTMWDRLGGPKSTVPTSVMVGEDEHVILFNRKAGWALDPTGKQFDLPFFTRWAADKTKTPYSSFHKLTKTEIDDARKEAHQLRGSVAEKEHEQEDYAAKRPRIVPKPVTDFTKGYVPQAATKWLRNKAIWVTGLADQQILDGVKDILLGDVKRGASIGDTIDLLFKLFDPYIGSKVEPEVVSTYRLENIVRTNTTDAYNQGRLQEFTKPGVVDFVLGIRYNAILDERTTPVCHFLGTQGFASDQGFVFKPDDPDLETLTPPNHFQCRSILTPIVVGMTVDKDEYIKTWEKKRARALADQKFLAEETATDNEGHEGVWRTISGRHTFIRVGETPEQAIDRATEGRAVQEAALAVAEAMGFDPDKVQISSEDKEFVLNGMPMKYAGSANLQDGTITIYEKFVNRGNVGQVVAHEIGHQRFQTVLNASQHERETLMKDPMEHPKGIIKPDGTLREGLGLEKKYPLFAALQPFQDARFNELRTKDGVSDYSKAWWKDFEAGKASTTQAMHETFAEITRLEAQGVKLVGAVSPVWRGYYKAVNKVFKELKK